MRLAKCTKGHYYDKDKFTECPHCSGAQVAPGETVAYAKTEMPDFSRMKVKENVEKEEVKEVQEEKEPRLSYRTEEGSVTDARLFTEEINPYAVAEEKEKILSGEPKLSTEQIDSVFEASSVTEEPALDEMKTIMLEPEDALVAPLQEERIKEPGDKIDEVVVQVREEKIEEIENKTELEESVPVKEEKEEPKDKIELEENVPVKEKEEPKDKTELGESVPIKEEKEKTKDKTELGESVSIKEEKEEPKDKIELEESVPVKEKEEPKDKAELEESIAVKEEKVEQNQEVTAAKKAKSEVSSLKSHLADVVSSRMPEDYESPREVCQNTNPVVGWLIALNGVNRGRSYEVKEGRNFVGSSMTMEICLENNEKVCKEKHAIVTYDPRSKKYFFQPGETRDLIYVNDELLLGPEEIHNNDILFMAGEEFLFMELKHPKIDWK